MPRPLVVGNGKLLINIDDHLQMRDLYYPYVGELNHIGGYYSRFGVWVDGQFSWTNQEDWHITLGYKKDTLVSQVFARNDKLQLELEINHGVHQRENIYLKKIRVKNMANRQRVVKLFLHHDFSLNETSVGDTAVFDPELNVIYHYQKNVYILANGAVDNKGIHQYTTGVKRFNHSEGTWRDAEDGELTGNPISQGSIDSTISLMTNIAAQETKELYYWLCVGKNLNEVKRLNQYVTESSPEGLLERISVYWDRWVNKTPIDYADLSSEVVDLYKRSLLVVRTQTDQNGAFLAANDSDILQFNRDHYSYMWPRDGALVAYAMSKAGYEGIVNSFFEFCAKILTKEGYMLHKYNPDGSIGSSWHPLIENNQIQMPIQEDETALVLFALWEHYKKFNNIEFIQSLYVSLIRPAAKFLMKYTIPELNLPKPSYDLWEERRGIFTFTASSVYAGLKAAAHFADLFGDEKRKLRYDEAAENIKDGILKHLYDPELERFLRGIYINQQGEITKDFSLESSIYGIFEFGVLPASDPRVKRTMNYIREGLKVKTEVGGIARYYNDYYFQKSHDLDHVPGNPWIICTLWMAEFQIEASETLEELQEVKSTLEWVVNHAMKTGVLPEQLHPYSGEGLSVAPLTWSHSTFVLTVQKYLEQYKKLSNKNVTQAKVEEKSFALK